MTDNNTKDTIYVDIDDEITGLIDKVRQSSGRVVALVLPKRATVLQSIVNMKLLKRIAETDKKHIVLITTEASLLPLAGAVGLYTAKTLSSKPEIPSSPDLAFGSQLPETISEDMSMPLDDEDAPDLTKQAGKAVTVGALAEAAHQPLPPRLNDQSLETIELDNEDEQPPAEDLAPAAVDGKKSKKPKKDKNLKVPNFDRFRLLVIIVTIVIIVLLILGFLAFSVLPHASIDVKTNAANVNANLTLTLDPQAQSSNASTGDIPATQVSQQKTFTQTVNTTGQKNEGATATGSVTMTADDCNNTYLGNLNFTIPAGTGIGVNNLTYITQSDTNMYISGAKHSCVQYTATGPTQITAQSPGSSYNNNNLQSTSVSGYPEVSASGSASGGTDNIVQTVAQADITTATSKINASNSGSVKDDLINQLKGQGLYPIDATFASGTPQVSANPSVGTASSTVTVTETVTYTMYGAYKSDIVKLLNDNILSQTGKSQNIISNGLISNDFKQVGSNGSTDQVSLSSIASVGPNISVNEIRKQAAGKSPQAIITAIKNNPDVTSVTVRLSPFWVSSAPSNISKISVNVAKPNKSV